MVDSVSRRRVRSRLRSSSSPSPSGLSSGSSPGATSSTSKPSGRSDADRARRAVGVRADDARPHRRAADLLGGAAQGIPVRVAPDDRRKRVHPLPAARRRRRRAREPRYLTVATYPFAGAFQALEERRPTDGSLDPGRRYRGRRARSTRSRSISRSRKSTTRWRYTTPRRHVLSTSCLRASPAGLSTRAMSGCAHGSRRDDAGGRSSRASSSSASANTVDQLRRLRLLLVFVDAWYVGRRAARLRCRCGQRLRVQPALDVRRARLDASARSVRRRAGRSAPSRRACSSFSSFAGRTRARSWAYLAAIPPVTLCMFVGEPRSGRSPTEPSVDARRQARSAGPSRCWLRCSWSIVMTWPLALHLGSETAQVESYDPLYLTWQLAWIGHALLHAPLHLFQSNLYWPLTHNLTFTDVIFGYAPAGLIAAHGPHAALVVHNLAVHLHVRVRVPRRVPACARARRRRVGRHRGRRRLRVRAVEARAERAPARALERRDSARALPLCAATGAAAAATSSPAGSSPRGR